jgi:hypothetical protein
MTKANIVRQFMQFAIDWSSSQRHRPHSFAASFHCSIAPGRLRVWNHIAAKKNFKMVMQALATVPCPVRKAGCVGEPVCHSFDSAVR